VLVLSTGNQGALAKGDLERRWLIELAAAEALMSMRGGGAARGQWRSFDRMLEGTSRPF